MELAISAAKPRLSELVAAAQRGERVVITKRGEPAAELIACPKSSDHAKREPQGDFFARLDAACKRAGIEQIPPDEARKLFAEFDDPAFSRRALFGDLDG